MLVEILEQNVACGHRPLEAVAHDFIRNDRFSRNGRAENSAAKVFLAGLAIDRHADTAELSSFAVLLRTTANGLQFREAESGRNRRSGKSKCSASRSGTDADSTALIPTSISPGATGCSSSGHSPDAVRARDSSAFNFNTGAGLGPLLSAPEPSRPQITPDGHQSTNMLRAGPMPCSGHFKAVTATRQEITHAMHTVR